MGTFYLEVNIKQSPSNNNILHIDFSLKATLLI